MPPTNIVLNASPLILLCNSNLEFVLPEMFTEIVVPDAVWQEILRSPLIDRAIQRLPSLDWLNRVAVTPASPIVRWDLGPGETEVLIFSLEQRDYIPVLDDLHAKKCARSLGIPTLGTGAILILAKERELIESVESALRQLQKVGLWISESVIQLLKHEAGE